MSGGYSPQRLLFVTSGLGVGGAETALYTLLKGLKDSTAIAVVSLTRGGLMAPKIKALGIHVYEFNIKNFLLFPFYLYQYRRIIKKFKPTLIQGWMYHGNLFAHLGKVLSPSARVFLCIRQSLEGLRLEKKPTRAVIALDALLSKHGDRILYNSHTGQKTHELYGYAKGRSLVLPNGFDTKRFQPDQNNHARLCDALHIDPSHFLIGMVARFHAVKDHVTFIQGAAALSQKYPHVHFILVGAGVTRENAFLASHISLYPSLALRMHLLGLREDIPFLTAGLDVATSCSLSEGMPNAVCEALACGTLCVATDVGDSRHIMGEAGLIIPPRSPLALCQAWETLVQLPLEERRLLSQKGRLRILTTYTTEHMIKTYEKLVNNG